MNVMLIYRDFGDIFTSDLDHKQCSFGIVSVDLYDLLRSAADARDDNLAFFVDAKHGSWMHVLSIPWRNWIQSGWPIFGVLNAIAETHGYHRSGCDPLEGEEELEPKILALQTITDPNEKFLNDLQSTFCLTVEWGALDRALRSCVIRQTIWELDRLSRKFARVNWVDAYPLMDLGTDMLVSQGARAQSFHNFGISY